MAEEDTPQDAAYSDEEFSSDEDNGDYEEFADEDAEINEKQDAVEHEKAAEEGEEDADDYDAEFDEDGPVVTTAGPPLIETSELPIEPTTTDADDKEIASRDDAELYDGEFDEDSTVFDAEPPPEKKNEVAGEETPATADMTQIEALIAPKADILMNHDQANAVDDNEAEYSVDSEDEGAPALPEPTILPRTLSEESVSPRRSSVPTSVIARLTEDFPPKARFGSMPLVLSAAPVDKWMDSIPLDLSPERYDRSRKQSACFPVQEETQQQNLAEEENSTDDAENDTQDDGNAAVPNAVRSNARAQSYRDLQSEKVVIPVRRTQSLLYTGSLPCVEEIQPSEEVADPPQSQEGDETYSDDNGSGGEASHDSFESDHENDDAQPTLPERPKSGPSSALYDLPDHEVTPKTNEEEFTGDVDKYSPAVQTPDRAPTPEHVDPPQSNKYDDDYADEMDDEFASDSEVPQFDGENTPQKSSSEASDYDVDEFIEDGRRETETLLQEARTLLELQQKESEPHTSASEQQNDGPDPAEQAAGNGEEPTEQPAVKEGKTEGTGDEIVATMYDDDDEFDTDTPRQPTPEQDADADNDGVGQYELDNDEFETQDLEIPQVEVKTTVENLGKVDSEKVVDADVHQDAKMSESLQSACEADNDATKTDSRTPLNESLQPKLDEVAINAESATPTPVSETLQPISGASNTAVKAENEIPALEPPSEQPALNTDATEVEAFPGQATEDALPTKAQVTVVAKNEKKQALTESKRREPGQTPARPARPVKNASRATTQPSPPIKPTRPATNRTPAPPSAPHPLSATDKKPTTTPRSSRTRLKPSTVDHQVSLTNPAEYNTESKTATTSDQAPQTQVSPSKRRPKVSSPRSPSKPPSASYQYLPNEYPQLPRKAPVPRQKAKPSTSGEHGGKRRLLQPVRTPANLRFDLPKMDKTKRDWLFANMFRHGDDLTKYESFVPPTLRARPPTSSNLKETKKRPLSARQVYGDPQPFRFVSPSRRLVQQPNPALQDRERNWVPTTPHDSKLPPYDSILDKYCTTVTSPVVQRQIYQTRHRDLSPQLAFVLEKRVEKHCRKGFYDSFGGVSSSYKTEIVPTSPVDGSRQRQTSPRSPTKSEMLPTTSPTSAPEDKL